MWVKKNSYFCRRKIIDMDIRLLKSLTHEALVTMRKRESLWSIARGAGLRQETLNKIVKAVDGSGDELAGTAASYERLLGYYIKQHPGDASRVLRAWANSYGQQVITFNR